MQQDIVIGLDGGQTSTLCLCATLDGAIIGSALAGASNHYDEPGGAERLENAVTSGIHGALLNAGAEAERVAAIHLGLTGAAEQGRVIAERLLPSARVTASFDMVTALAGASGGAAGVVVIAGTGSIAYGALDDGRAARAGGWGYLMGDEGSGYDIGVQAVRAAAQAHDGRAAPTPLTRHVPQALGFSDLWALHRAMYAHTVSRAQIAGLARVVSEGAAAGDTTAQRLLQTAGAQLADAAGAVLTALSSAESGLPVYTTGGVFAAGDLILRSFRDRLAVYSPHSTVRPAQFTPAVGALLLALRSAGATLSNTLLERLRATLPPQAAMKQHS